MEGPIPTPRRSTGRTEVVAEDTRRLDRSSIPHAFATENRRATRSREGGARRGGAETASTHHEMKCESTKEIEAATPVERSSCRPFGTTYGGYAPQPSTSIAVHGTDDEQRINVRHNQLERSRVDRDAPFQAPEDLARQCQRPAIGSTTSSSTQRSTITAVDAKRALRFDA